MILHNIYTTGNACTYVLSGSTGFRVNDMSVFDDDVPVEDDQIPNIYEVV